MTARRDIPTGPAFTATETTLAALQLPDSDAALAALVRLYAAELDRAEERGRAFDKLFERLSRQREPDAYEALSIARSMLSARNTLDRLGGRLHAGLAELRATPRSRPMLAPHAPTASPLGKLRLAAGTEVDAAQAQRADARGERASYGESAADEFLARTDERDA
jgi:hypothetical protein